ncbi:MAG: fatty acid--CoA ligase [Halieaceae bacterium]|jgi:acyl-CoA synthetase (AMP-forming)/AMP-acid ligase II|nr:fatty acid--CoA ligase [Halieaceae bacterium]
MDSFNSESLSKFESHDDLELLSDITRFHAARTPDNIALSFEDRETTFSGLDRHASQVANGLILEGIPKQKNVAWLDANSDHFFEMLFGCAKSNTVICPLNWRLAASELVYIINDSEAEILFVGQRFVETVATIRDQLVTVATIVVVSGSHSHWQDYRSWRDSQSVDDPGLTPSPTDTAIQMYTSGTTGYPKGVLISCGALLASTTDGSAEMAWNQWSSADVSLLVMPCFHIAGLRWGVMGLIPGATTLILPEFDPVRVTESISTHRVTRLFLVPAALRLVLQVAKGQTCDFSSLQLIWYGASPIPLALLKEAMSLCQCDFVQTYGLTETGAQTTYLPPQDHHRSGTMRMKSAGKALPNIMIRIEGRAGQILGPHEIGEICVRSPANMIGYWKQPKETARTVINGWVHTGDAGYLDEDGYVYIHDRIKDMIVSGGENIYPAEVENAIYGHPAITDVAVIGVPDDKWGEAVKALVVLAPGRDCTPEEIIAYARAHIATYKAPKSVDFIDELPRNQSGKILKKDLRAKYWEGLGRSV